jgi:hypothetical protein
VVLAVGGSAKTWIRSPLAERRCFGNSAKEAENLKIYHPVVEYRSDLSRGHRMEHPKNMFSLS